MSEELKWIENKAIIVHEDVMPIQVKGKLIYPKAYFEDDVKALIKKVKEEAQRELLEQILKKIEHKLKYAWLKEWLKELKP